MSGEALSDECFIIPKTLNNNEKKSVSEPRNLDVQLTNIFM